MLEVKEQVIDGLPTTDSKAAFSDKTQDLMDALSLLYIRYNASGRNIFREKWPDVAEYLFGEELTKYDEEGVNDFERRKELELEAGERRIALKSTIKELVNKSVEKGMLQLDYVGQVIDEYGASISQYLYEGNIIERVRPGIMAKYKGELDAQEGKEQEAIAAFDKQISEKSSVCANIIEAPAEQKLSVEEKSILSNASDGVRVMETHSSTEEIPDEATKLDEYINATEETLSENIVPVETLQVEESVVPEVAVTPEAPMFAETPQVEEPVVPEVAVTPEAPMFVETPQAEENVAPEVVAVSDVPQEEKKAATPITFSNLSESVDKVSVLLEPQKTDADIASGEQGSQQ